MIELSVFPKTFFGLEVPQSINERLLDVIKKLDFSYDHFPHPLTTNTNIHKDESLCFYIEYLNKQLSLIKQKQKWSCEKISISSMWANKSESGRYSSRHNHPMSWWSFIHYLTEGSPTYFFDHHAETPWMHLGEYNQTNVCFEPGKNVPVGSILFFPSYVPHQVEPHTGNNPRYTIAGNTFPEGSIDPDIENDRHYLNIRLL